MVKGKAKLGDKYIVPAGTTLRFINLQQHLITTKKYVIKVTNTLSVNDTSFFGDLYEVIFEHMIPGLLKVPNGETISDLSIVEPLGDILEPKILTAKYNKDE